MSFFFGAWCWARGPFILALGALFATALLRWARGPFILAHYFGAQRARPFCFKKK
jgi:hypothetical protein